MHLPYRGQFYGTSATVIDASATGETATFMGQPYACKQFAVTHRQQSAELIYRGVRYFEANQPFGCLAIWLSGCLVIWQTKLLG